MRINHIEYYALDIALSEPYTIAYETVTKASNIVLKIITDQGLIGWGCAAPDTFITGETCEDVINNIKNVIIPVFQNQYPFQISKFCHTLKHVYKLGASTRAMVDTALYDLLARKAEIPLYQLLGGYRNSIPTSVTIGILSVEDTIKKAEQYLQSGFTILKLKGGLTKEEDIEKISKLREQFGMSFSLRFDANQGFSKEEALDFLKKTKKANIEIFEQPICSQKDQILAHITPKTEIPVMADESIRSLKDAYHFVSNDLIDMINIKLMKVGGIFEASHINSVAKAAGMEIMVGCLDECSLGISAGLHFALSRPNIEFADLDSHFDLINDPFRNLVVLQGGVLYPSSGYGLGDVSF